MASRIGVIGMTIDNVGIPIRGNVKIMTGGRKREMITGADGVHAVKVGHEPGSFEFESTWIGDIDWELIFEASSAEISLRLENGQIASMSDGEYTGSRELNTEEGTVPLTFHGRNVRLVG